MTWLTVLPPLFASLGILFLPGLAVGLLIGIRGLWAAALAPLISATLITIASIVLPFAGLPWAPWAVMLCVALLGLAVVLLFKFVLRARFTPQTTGLGGFTTLAAALSGTAIASWAVFGIGDVNGISQTFDNIYHLNVLRFISETANASPLDVGKLTSGGFYPDGWHAFVSLAQSISGADLAPAVHGFNIAAASTVWPLGILLLTRQLVPASPLTVLTTGVLAAAFPTLPLNLLNYGVLYPYFFGMIMVPALLALILQLVGVASAHRISSTLTMTVLLAGLVPGISLAHPGAMMAGLALSVPAALVACFTQISQASRRTKAVRLLALGCYLAVGTTMLLKIRPDASGVWGRRMPLLDALQQSVLLNLLGYGLPLAVAVFSLLGLIAALRRRRRSDITLMGIWLVAILLFFVAAGVPLWRIRLLFTGVWYGDTPRLAAIVPIAIIPLAVAGIAWLWTVLPLSDRSRRSPLTLTAFTVLIFGVTQVTSGLPSLAQELRLSHEFREDAKLISTDELTLLTELPDLVSTDSRIAGNPWTGTSLAYAYTGIPVVLPHIFVVPTPDESAVLFHLQDWATNPAVCTGLKASEIDYVLDFGEQEVHDASHSYEGIDRIVEDGLGIVIAEHGDARLIKITACGADAR